MPSNPLQQVTAVLTNERLFMIASDVMKFNTIVVDIMQDTQARLVFSVDRKLRIIGLSSIEKACVRPWIEAPTRWIFIRGRDFLIVVHPKPAVDVAWLRISAAPVRRALMSRCPNVIDAVLFEEVLHHLKLLLCVDRNCVHAVTSADLSRLSPSNASIL